jgi:ATPase subunit of ABC transporter with duplicated ATPase domains
MASIDALAKAFRTFPGAILLVSHDVGFIRQVIEGKKSKHDEESSEESESEELGFDSASHSSIGKIFVVMDAGLHQVETVDEAVKYLTEPKKKTPGSAPRGRRSAKKHAASVK